MKNYLLLAVLIVSVPFSHLWAQDKKELAKEKAQYSIMLADAEKFDSAMLLMKEAISLDPANSIYPYEIAYDYYQQKYYDSAVAILKGLLNRPDAQDRYYQLLGNSYDFLKQPDQAIATYDAGLVRFPTSANLHLERGIMYLFGTEKSTEKAATSFEKGVQGNPMFASNYYWLAKIYCASSEKVWGVIYGELFMNLEPGSKRTEEISALLYKTYSDAITFKDDTSFNVSFSKITTINPKNPKKTALFGVMAFEPTIGLSIVGEKKISLASLSRIRSKFIDRYYKQELNKEYPNVLFDFQRDLKEAGHLDAYSNWIFLKGNETEFELWQKSHQKEWDAFTAYYEKHLLQLTDANAVYFGKY